MDEIMLRIDNVSKKYKLGQIGGTTLRDELQRKMAKLKGQEDPTKKIGAKDYNKGETFMALNGVSFDVKKGERVGIIGHNGAGKSTLLKLISRVTAPTGGKIQMNGRVASMLEVGTGFHPELTGRENIYMNGAILGMTKKEIDAKMEEIIEFSEVRQFIDTPVKRYSSGMYVKLAFSVAAHLDSEIMIMDEVLAVGDMAFQKKCLSKMNDVSRALGRTILYVSHNMNTIRLLCDRVIVLSHGEVIFDGNVEDGIGIYMQEKAFETTEKINLLNSPRYSAVAEMRKASFEQIRFIDGKNGSYTIGDNMHVILKWISNCFFERTSIRFVFWSQAGYPAASSMCIDFSETQEGENTFDFVIPTSQLMAGIYNVTLVLLEKNEVGTSFEVDVINPAFSVQFEGIKDLNWSPSQWGYIRFPDMVAKKIED